MPNWEHANSKLPFLYSTNLFYSLHGWLRRWAQSPFSKFNVNYNENKIKMEGYKNMKLSNIRTLISNSKSRWFIRTSKLLVLTLQQITANLPPLCTTKHWVSCSVIRHHVCGLLGGSESQGKYFFSPLGNNTAICFKQMAKGIKSHDSVILKWKICCYM